MTFACHQSWEVAHGSTPLQRNSESNDRHLSFASATEFRAQVSVPTTFITYPIIHEDESEGSSPRLRRETASLKCQKLEDKRPHGHQPTTSVRQVLERNYYKAASSGRIGCSFWNSGSFSTLCVVAEEKPWEDDFKPLEFAQEEDSLLSTSSSIGANSSEEQEWEDDTGDCEAQSKYQGPLDSFCSLEEALPSKKGLSNFYVGKSRSYGCLADVTSVADIAKPETPYAKKRKHLFASVEKKRFYQIQDRSSKRPNKAQHISNSNLVTCSQKLGQKEDHHFTSSPSRSLSLSDLQHARHHYF